ncbi:hypothetical protein BKA69DRAFT_1056219 [Paraphysoderma sedebokerense]|nr:hypothetical protein BKA69DRAFT_1056219 [Paraphysoderma sedebokerense]
MNLKFLPVFFVLALLNGAYAMDEEDPSNVPESCHRIVEKGLGGFFNKQMESMVVSGLRPVIRQDLTKEFNSVKNTILGKFSVI